MSFDFTRIWDNKKKFRRHLANLPIAEKLAMLEVLRERLISLRGSRAFDDSRVTQPKRVDQQDSDAPIRKGDRETKKR